MLVYQLILQITEADTLCSNENSLLFYDKFTVDEDPEVISSSNPKLLSPQLIISQYIAASDLWQRLRGLIDFEPMYDRDIAKAFCMFLGFTAEAVLPLDESYDV
jgi:hypothetical protein